MRITEQRGFLRSRAGRGFLVYVLLCAGLSVAIGYGVYQSNLRWFEASKSEEKLTALELADAFFSTYSELRGRFGNENVPVPATFRAHAIERFNKNRDPAETMRLTLAGVPGREIRIPPSDVDMGQAILALAASADPRPTSRWITNGDQPFLRTLYPSIASQPSCVECHNNIQVDQHWKLNEVMGAFALDVPLAPFLRETRREAALIAGGVFVLACGIGLYVFLLQFRAYASDIYKRLSDAVENLTDGFAIHNPSGGLVLSNPAHRRFEALAGSLPYPIGEPQPAPESFSQEVSLGENTWINLREIHTRSGDIVRIETDISALKRREVELRSAKNEAERANRAKSDFLALMSHELRTPLNAIIGFSEVIHREMFGPIASRYRNYAGDINDSGQHLLGVISDILDMAKVESGKVDLADDDVELAAVVGSCFRLLRERAHAGGIALRAEVPSGLRLIADELRLKQVILNLVTNSVKFTPRGGTVTVLASLGEDGGAAVTVVDNGIGMTDDEIPKALAAFQQVDSQVSRRYGGTGLGLPISKMLIELHGGSLAIHSEPGVGTRVTIAFPSGRVACEPKAIAS